MKIRTAISPNYVKGWSVDKALREVLQNYLDTLAEFKCRGRISWKNGYANIKDNGPGLEMRHLALGVSEKSDTAKGQFGEGLKLALLVLAREGRAVEVHTKSQVIRPVIEFDETFGTDIMVLNVRPGEQGFQGTTIRVACTEQELNQAKGYFIEFNKPSDLQWLEPGRISLPGGHIYLNGTRIGAVDGALFSYHLTGKMDLGNRDREVVDMNKVKPEIRRILGETRSNEVLRRLFKALLLRVHAPDIEAGMSLGYIPVNRRKAWKKVFNEVAGGSPVLACGDYAIDLYAQGVGYNVVTIHNWEWRYALQDLGVKDSQQAVRKVGGKKDKTIPLTRLTETELKHLRTARRLVKHHYHDPKKIVIVDKIRDLSADGFTVNGCYDPKQDKIFLARDILSDQEQTLFTLLHETVHKYTGHADNTREFETALLQVAVGIIVRGGKKKKM